MKKKLLLCLFCGVLVLGVSLPSLYAVDAPGDPIKLSNVPNKKYSAVMFKHSVHADKECTACHHTWDGASPVKKCTDSGCHDQLDSKVKKGVHSYYNAIHARKGSNNSCLSCHKKIEDKAKKKLLTNCTKGCHTK
jgi:hypothetical protein